MDVNSETIVLSVALNYYDKIYDRCLQSHIRYSSKYSFQYCVLSYPTLNPLLMECAWLKVPLMLSAMKSGYKSILYVDADTWIQEDAPDFRTTFSQDHDIYLAQGFSGRINSGVVILKNTEDSQKKLLEILHNAGCDKPAEDNVGWGENGDFIFRLKNYARFGLLDKKWNNNHQPSLDDFIRHFSAGPMRKHYNYTDEELKYKDKLKEFLKNNSITQTKVGSDDFYDRLYDLQKETFYQYKYLRSLQRSEFSRRFET